MIYLVNILNIFFYELICNKYVFYIEIFVKKVYGKSFFFINLGYKYLLVL